MTCYHTPCHTKGHICYYLETNGCQDGAQHEIAIKGKYMLVSNVNRCVFTGDTLFIGGCGFFMEGTAAEMLKAMDTINTLPDDTKVFVGHEYTLKNMEFAMKAEGQTNSNIPKAQEKFKSERQAGEYTFSLLRDEREFNVFMRCRRPEL
jgi:hydroxyacylglutathione hydrolase